MSDLEQLLVAQGLDTTLDQLRHRQDRIPEREELASIDKADALLTARRQQIDEEAGALARSQKRLEDEIALVEAKRVETDRKLYGGIITAARELQALQEELGALDRRTSALEDELLDVLTATEPVDAARAQLDGEAAVLTAKRADAEARLATVEAEIGAELERVTAERSEVASSVPGERLSDYERRRRELGGIAIARLVGSSCGGCHLMLSAMEIDRIRRLAPDEPASCEECGRLLVR